MVAEENIKIYNWLVKSMQITVAPVQNVKEVKTNYTKCKYCNSEIPINSSYCISCGKKL